MKNFALNTRLSPKYAQMLTELMSLTEFDGSSAYVVRAALLQLYLRKFPENREAMNSPSSGRELKMPDALLR